MKSIQQANIDDTLRHMAEAKQRNDLVSFNKEKELHRETIESIKNADSATYTKYVHLLDKEM